MNRATRNFDLKALRRILADGLAGSPLREQYGKSGLLPGGLEPASIPASLMADGLANDFFKSETSRRRIVEALQEISAGIAEQVGQLAPEQVEAALEGLEPEQQARWIWALGTSENPALLALAQELLRRKPTKPVPKKPEPEPAPAAPASAEPAPALAAPAPSPAEEEDEHDAASDEKPLTRKARRLQNTVNSLHKEVERLRQDRERDQEEAKALERENQVLRKRLEGLTEIDPLKARLEQLEKEREHVIYELNRKTHELHQLQKKYEIFNRLDTEVLILRSKVAQILNDAIVERKRFADQLSAITESNLRSLDYYRDQKDKNLGPPERNEEGLRVGVFVDVQNMFYAARNKFNGRLDYQALLRTVVSGRKLVRANAYIIQTPDIDQSNFILLLEHCGYEVHSKYLRTRYDGSAKGDWDMEIAIDIISMIGQLDVVILVSGDGDFVALVKMLQRHGLDVEVHSFEHNTAVDLREAANRFFPIQEDLILH